jgi:hypothetical protein
LKSERWGSPFVQEKYHGEKACYKKQQHNYTTTTTTTTTNNNNNNNNNTFKNYTVVGPINFTMNNK